MSGVRVLVGTRKGAFVLSSDGKRERWDVSGPHFAGLGDLPREGIARRSESPVRVAEQRLVRPADSAIERRGQDVGAGRQRVRVRRRARHAPVVRRHAAPVGVRPRVAPRTVADRSRHRLRRRPGRGAVPLDGRGWELARAGRPPRPRLGPALAARCRRPLPPHDRARPDRPEPDVHRHLRRRRVPDRRWRRHVAADQPRAEIGGHPRSRTPRSATASTASPCTRRVRACSSCRSTGTSCGATMRATRGTR